MTDPIQPAFDAIQTELSNLREVNRDLETFIAGCETGGNKTGADFARNLKWKLTSSTDSVRTALGIIERNRQGMLDSVQRSLAEAEEVKQEASDKIKRVQAKMDKLKRTMAGAKAVAR